MAIDQNALSDILYKPANVLYKSLQVLHIVRRMIEELCDILKKIIKLFIN